MELRYWAAQLSSRAGRGRRAKIAVVYREARAPLARGSSTDLARLHGRRGTSCARYAIWVIQPGKQPHYGNTRREPCI